MAHRLYACQPRTAAQTGCLEAGRQAGGGRSGGPQPNGSRTASEAHYYDMGSARPDQGGHPCNKTSPCVQQLSDTP